MRRPNRARRGALVVVWPLALVAVLLTGGSTLALWGAGAVYDAGTVHTGDLRLTVGEMTWQQVTPGVVDPASGSLTDRPADFWSMPGDVVEIHVPVTTFLKGDNLAADLTVDYDTSRWAGDVDATFTVQDADGHQVAGSAPVGSSLAVPALVGDDSGVTARWTVVVRAEVLGDYRWVTPATAGQNVDWRAGSLHVTLDQVRLAGGA